MKKNKTIASIAILGVLAIVNPTSNKIVYASTAKIAGWFTSSDTVVNNFKAEDIKVNINENFITPNSWSGDKVTKEVEVKNDNSNAELVRVSIIPRWTDDKGNPWGGDVNYANIEFANLSDWIDGKDGYYYYNKLLDTNQTTSKIIRSVKADIPPDQKQAYKNKTLVVDVNVEVVQPTKEAYKALWNTNQSIQNILDALCQ